MPRVAVAGSSNPVLRRVCSSRAILQLRRSPFAPPSGGMSTTALAVYDPRLSQLLCVVCDNRPSADVPWAAYRVTYAPDRVTEVSRAPCGDFCLDCKESVCEAVAPGKADLPAIAVQCRTCAQHKNKYKSYRARRDGKRTTMQRGSVHTVTRVGCRWEETAEPVRKQDLQEKAPDVDISRLPVPFIKVKDSNMVQQEVVLAKTEQAPRVIMFTEVVAEFQEHSCIGPQQLRSAQAQEFWRKLLAETMHSRPSGATVTHEQLDRMMEGLGAWPPAPAERADRHGAEEDGTTVVTVMEGEEGEARSSWDSLAASSGGAFPGGTAAAAATTSSGSALLGGVASGGAGGIASDGGGFLGGDAAHGARTGAENGKPAAAQLAEDPSGRGGRASKKGRGRGGRGSSRGAAEPADEETGTALKKLKKSSTPRDADADVPITAISFLAGAFTYPKVAVYHAEQRLGSMLERKDVMTQRQLRREHDALIASSRLIPTLLISMPDEELSSLVGTLIAGKVCEKTWPDITFITLIQRRCMMNVMHAEKVFQICWPFRRAEAPAAAEFNVLTITMADLPDRPSLQKVQISADRLVNDFLATHMPKLADGTQQIVDMGKLMLQAYVPDGDSEECATARTLRGRMIAVAGYVQEEPVSAEQVECMMELKKGNTMDASIEDLLQDPWWMKCCKDTWRVAATESSAKPIIDSLIAQFTASDAPSLADTAPAWNLVEEMLPRWKPPKMRATGLNHLWRAMETCLLNTSKTLLATSDAGPDWQTQAEQLRTRLVRFQQHVPNSMKEEMAAVAAAASKQEIASVLGKGMGLLSGMGGAPSDDAGVTQLLEAFGPCVSVGLADENATSIAQAVSRMVQDEDMSRDKVELAKIWVAMLQSSEAGAAAYAKSCAVAVDSMEAQLKKTGTALELQDALASGASVESRALVCKLMSEWERSSKTAVVGGTDMQARAEQIGSLATAWLKDAFGEQISAASIALEKAVEELDARSRGGKEVGESWKKALTADSTWAHVLREAAYYFTSEETPAVPMSKVLDQLFSGTQAAWSEYKKTCGLARQPVDAALQEKTDKVSARARITNVECYFLEVLSSNAAPGTISTKLQNRVASMAKHQMSTDDLLPQIWERAAAAM